MDIVKNLIKSAFNKDMPIDVSDYVHIDIADNQQPCLYTDVYRQEKEIIFFKAQNIIRNRTK